MKTEQQYADDLIEKYYKTDPCGNHMLSTVVSNICIHLSLRCAIIDVENTIEALDKVELVSRRYYRSGEFGDDKLGKEIMDSDINNDGKDYIAISNNITYYQNVLQILKDKL